MLTINLLPPEEKIIIRTEVVGRTIRFFACAVIVVFIIGSVLLFPSFLPMVFERRELVRALDVSRVAAKNDENDAVAAEVRALARDVAAVKRTLSRAAPAPLVLDALSQSSVDGIVITNLTVKESREFAVSGVATNRRNLLAYEKTLRSSGLVERIEFPISNIIPETNIHFAVRGTLKEGFEF